MKRIEVGQYRQKGYNGPKPWENDIHAIRPDGKPGCGRVVTVFEGKPMELVTWTGRPDEVDCHHGGCVVRAN